MLRTRLWLTFALACLALTGAVSALPLDPAVRDAIQTGSSRADIRWGVAVESTETGEMLASRNLDEPMKPASTLKALVCAMALDELGPDHRIATTVYADGPRDGGTLRGDLWVLGLADPSYNRRQSASALTAIRNLAQSVRDAGITRVTGDLVITGLFVYNDARGAADTLGRGTDALVLSNDIRDRGRRTPTDHGMARIVSQSDFFREANRDAGQRLRQILREVGVSVEGSVLTSTTLDPPGTVVARRLSPPLSSLCRRILHHSINLHADLILLHAGYTVRQRDGGGEAEIRLRTGIEVAEEWLARRAGISTVGLHMVDGSGLSHRNRMTPRHLLGVMRAMANSPAFDAWLEALPSAGRSGTLEGRFRGTEAEANLRGKTGTLTGVVSLVGYVIERTTGERLAYAIVENSPYDSAYSTYRARQVLDRIALAITRGAPRSSRTLSGPGPRAVPPNDGSEAGSETFGTAPDLEWVEARGTTLTSGVIRTTPDGDGLAGRIAREGAGEAYAVTGPHETDRARVSVDVHLSHDTSVQETSAVPYQGLVVRAEGEDWVRFVADFDSDRMLKLQARIGGSWRRLATWTFPEDFPDPGGSGWHTMTLEIDGDEYTAHFDGERLPGPPVTYGLRDAGQSGIFAQFWGRDPDTRTAHFDNFSVEILD